MAAVESIYRKLYTKFWEDAKVSKMTMEDRYVFLYLITSPHSNLANCYELSIGQASKEVGMHEDELLRIIHNLRDKYRVIDYDDEFSEILVCNRCKYDWTISIKYEIGINRQCKNIKNKEMRAYIEFLTSNKYGESNWDNEICNYYAGTWRDTIKED